MGNTVRVRVPPFAPYFSVNEDPCYTRRKAVVESATTFPRRRSALWQTHIFGDLTPPCATLFAIMIDDLIRGPEEAASPAIRQQLKDWYSSVVYNAPADRRGFGNCLDTLEP